MLTKEEIRTIIDKEANQELFKARIERAKKMIALDGLTSVHIFYISIFGTFEVEEAYFSEFISAEDWMREEIKNKEKNVEFFAAYLDLELKKYFYKCEKSEN